MASRVLSRLLLGVNKRLTTLTPAPFIRPPPSSAPLFSTTQHFSTKGPGDYGKGRGNNRNDSENFEEPRLFGEGGLFGKSLSKDEPTDDWDEQDEDQAASFVPFSPEKEDYEDMYEEREWSADKEAAFGQPTVEDYFPGQALESEGGWTTVVSEKGFTSETATAAAMDDTKYEWMPQEDTASSYIGRWAPDGRLIKGTSQIPIDLGSYPEADESISSTAFGDLIRRSGYTDDDIANLMAGFYEPIGLPHLDDYKFIDMDAERRKKRKEMELEKMAEMAKRWVRKVDAQGFAHAVGRRKTSNARVWIKEGRGRIVINKKHHDMYFPNIDDRVQYMEPFVVTDTVGMFDTFVLVRGGGTTGQAGAVRHGLSRALMWYEPSLRGILKKAGMLTRDPRMVERKKPGKAKARRSFQWVKR